MFRDNTMAIGNMEHSGADATVSTDRPHRQAVIHRDIYTDRLMVGRTD